MASISEPASSGRVLTPRDELIRLVTQHGQEALIAIIKELQTMPDLDVQALRESAKAHIERKAREGQEVRSAQQRTALPVGWAAAMTWLDDWTPDA